MKYRSEDDKCYGVAGMAVGLSILDAHDLFNRITIDAEGFDCIEFMPEFYFQGNPRLSAKDSWQCLYSHYQISIGLVIADTVCRKMILDHGCVDRKLKKNLLQAICDEGKAMCELEKDEVEPLFNRYFTHMVSVFSNAQVKDAVCLLVDKIKEQRQFSRVELIELMSELSII